MELGDDVTGSLQLSNYLCYFKEKGLVHYALGRYLPKLSFNFYPDNRSHSSVANYTSLAYFSEKHNVSEWNFLKRPFLLN
jgi:hypothetical protein